MRIALRVVLLLALVGLALYRIIDNVTHQGVPEPIIAVVHDPVLVPSYPAQELKPIPAEPDLMSGLFTDAPVTEVNPRTFDIVALNSYLEEQEKWLGDTETESHTELTDDRIRLLDEIELIRVKIEDPSTDQSVIEELINQLHSDIESLERKEGQDIV